MYDSAVQKSEVAKQISKVTLQNESNLRFINATIHEIRALNAAIKSQSEELAKSLDVKGIGSLNQEQAQYLQMNIFSTSSLVTMRLNAFDFYNNLELVFGKEPTLVEIYRKFHKIAHCLRVSSWREHARIHMDGTCYGAIQAHGVFEMLPFVLLDNAIKYAPIDTDVYITFFENRPRLNITVTSIGPTLKPGEESKIFDKWTRGEHSQKVVYGSGLGLHVAKLICDHYEIAIAAKSEKQDRYIDGVPYSRFTITLEFPQHNLEFIDPH